jgi:hypothetical protein
MCGVILHMARAALLGEETQRRERSRRRVKPETSECKVPEDDSARNVNGANLKAPKISPSCARKRMQDVLQGSCFPARL